MPAAAAMAHLISACDLSVLRKCLLAGAGFREGSACRVVQGLERVKRVYGVPVGCGCEGVHTHVF